MVDVRQPQVALRFGFLATGLLEHGTAGTMDQIDYDLWKNNFGSPGAGAISVAIPEPLSTTIVAIALLLMLLGCLTPHRLSLRQRHDRNAFSMSIREQSTYNIPMTDKT